MGINGPTKNDATNGLDMLKSLGEPLVDLAKKAASVLPGMDETLTAPPPPSAGVPGMAPSDGLKGPATDTTKPTMSGAARMDAQWKAQALYKTATERVPLDQLGEVSIAFSKCNGANATEADFRDFTASAQRAIRKADGNPKSVFDAAKQRAGLMCEEASPISQHEKDFVAGVVNFNAGELAAGRKSPAEAAEAVNEVLAQAGLASMYGTYVKEWQAATQSVAFLESDEGRRQDPDGTQLSRANDELAKAKATMESYGHQHPSVITDSWAK